MQVVGRRGGQLVVSPLLTRPSSSSTAGSSSSSSGSGGGSSFKRAGAAVAAGVGRMWCRAYDLTRPVGQAALDGAALVSPTGCDSKRVVGSRDDAPYC